MQRTVLGFSLRSTDALEAGAMAERIQEALGVSLTPGDHHRFRAHVGTAFGMTIALYPWGGPNGTQLFVLEGEVEDAAFVVCSDGSFRPADRLDVSDAVADVLNVRLRGNWHRPSEEELEAHTVYSRKHEE